MVAESGAFSIADLNGVELFEKDSNSDTEKDSEKDASEKESSDEFFTDVAKFSFASEITSKAFNSIRFTSAGAYQKIVVPPPEV